MGITGFIARQVRAGEASVIDWSRIPWSLWLLSALILLSSVPAAARGDGSAAEVILAPIISLVWVYFLLRGVRWLWFFSLAVCLLIILAIVLGSATWEGYVESVLGAALLLMPGTRQYLLGPRIRQRV